MRSGSGGHRHAVHFYGDDSFLVDLLTRLVGPALVLGEAAVVIATRAHRTALACQLRARGLDVQIARRQGRYIALDAAVILAMFMRGGWPDPVRFGGVVRHIMDDASGASPRSGGRVSAFAEMVALLWAQGKPEAAIRVEELWNDLAPTHAFSLCCAYPMSHFSNQRHAGSFMKICAQHSHVFPAERPAALHA